LIDYEDPNIIPGFQEGSSIFVMVETPRDNDQLPPTDYTPRSPQSEPSRTLTSASPESAREPSPKLSDSLDDDEEIPAFMYLGTVDCRGEGFPAGYN